jgi:hypothetical protein
MHQGYDLIGDIHGHADALIRLLTELRYRREGRGFCHASRRVIFVGDFIDRGPQIRETLAIAREMVASGAALAVMGNHEFNALAFHTPHPQRPGEYLRPHSEKNVDQHRRTLEQLPPGELTDYLEWFRTLPIALELDGLRVVHACWDDDALRRIAHQQQQHGGITAAFLADAVDPSSRLFLNVECVLKGPEAELPPGMSFLDKDGHQRTAIRARWYLPATGKTYSTYALQSDDVPCDAPLTAQAAATARPYPPDSPPVFVGHYWLRADRPQRLAANVACLDYSVAKGGYLCAYRWDGEREIDDGKFVVAQ